jgi:hypothetical protein
MPSSKPATGATRTRSARPEATPHRPYLDLRIGGFRMSLHEAPPRLLSLRNIATIALVLSRLPWHL